MLFPRTTKNPEGSKHLAAGTFSSIIRHWADALPTLDCAEVDDEGTPIRFPRDRVFANALRHTFAQRHADAGTPPDVLRELMGHDSIQTTLGYYRVTAKRKRHAQEMLGPLQINARGRLTRPGSSALADSEALREEIGQVAVPFGRCTEPSNVKADGHACPFRLRCPGCEYFRTDPSYQAELTGYLAKLLADREHLAAAVPELAEWARRDARPSDEEIDAVRRLIRSNDELVGQLSPVDRALVEEAIATVSTHRAQLDTSFPIELRAIVRQSDPDLFPTVERQLHAGHRLS